LTDISNIARNVTQEASGIWVAHDQQDVSYPEDGNEACFAVEDSSFWFQHRNSVISDLVRDYSPHDTIFDIGGGNGCVSSALQRAGQEVVLVEPGRQGACNAVQRGIGTVIQSTLQDAHFCRDSLPSAGLFDVLEHIEDDTGFLRDIFSYLRPGGRLYLTVPAYGWLWSAEDVHAGHFRRYTRRLLSDRLRDAGFEVTFSSYLFSFLVPPILLFRAIPTRLGLRRRRIASRTKKEHSAGPGFSQALIRHCLQGERGRIQRRKALWAGSSCIAVAGRPE